MKVVVMLIALVGCGQEPTGRTKSPRAISMLIADSTKKFQEAKTVLGQRISDIRELLDAIEKMKLTKDRNRLERIRGFFRFDSNSIKKITGTEEANTQAKRLVGSIKRWRAIELELTQVDSTFSEVLDELHETKLKVDKRMFVLVRRSGHSVPGHDKDALLKIETDAIQELIDEGEINVGKLVKSLAEGTDAIETATRIVEKKLGKL